MHSVLEDLFFGEIQPNLRSFGSDDPEIQKTADRVLETEELLLQLLEGKEWELFRSYVDALSEVQGSQAADDFIYGFQLGARFIYETLVMRPDV